ncbi:excalibur calcium-binding domain-containing protein [Mycobacterium nebraskense]|uniref:excalibur calcium-binding domain-containing protein n=1 Tax=Mycobacterium nebraskense TaxID=244292 RepID=UPI0009E4F5EA|nr:excalibur calcium-binding domain-containing protein [Mycobacterium nebraskense]MBI2693288.1 excalibur calcium-binding domain-containing protein [Mycobacterium nebraskense]MCV7119556.1 excalibur calcium-binding domain-containing protein [Mycobacterium nebraskense]
MKAVQPEARTAGPTFPKGDHAYRPKLDRDNDGIACESKAQRPWLAEVPRKLLDVTTFTDKPPAQTR